MNLAIWTKPAIFGMAAGAIGLAIVGFSFGGWVTGTTAHAMAVDEAKAEVIGALTPICIAKSEMDENSAAIMAKMKAEASYKRHEVLIDAGWATMPGDEKPNRVLAMACAREIGKTL